MKSVRTMAVLLIAFYVLNAAAQVPGGVNSSSGAVAKELTITVRITYDNARGFPANLRVSLASAYGSTVDLRTTDGFGVAQFNHVLPGKYKFVVSGLDIQTLDTGEIDLTDASPNVNEYLKVHKTDVQGTPGGETSVAEASVPPNARKEYDKGMKSLERKDYDSAKKSFEQAIALYPKYAQAQSGLATSYASLGQGEKAVEMFRAALENDDHLQMPNLYLGRFYYENKKYKEAEPYLLKAQTGDPQNAQILTALANCQYRNGEPDLALASARKVHSLKDHSQYAIAHLIAGDILTSKNQTKEAAEEYEMFLKEDPKSPLAPNVRDALTKLRAAK